MVLESLITNKNAERHPFLIFLLGLFYSSLAILMACWIFTGNFSPPFVSLIVFTSTPLLHTLIILEEKKDKYIKEERNILREHKKALVAIIALFLGFVVALTFWFVLLPETTSQELFQSQINELDLISGNITGMVTSPDLFFTIIFNNLRVLFFSLIFSFFFGAGAIFILSWNASLIATAIGILIKQSSSPSIGIFAYGFSAYMLHGIFEIGAYLVAGLAGGIISVAVIKHHFFSKEAKTIFNDALTLVGLSVLLLIIGGIIESFITPLLFF